MKHDLKTNNFERKVTRIYAILACTAMVMMVTAVPALAADDPLTVVNNLSEFIFSLIRAIGLILLGFGILQVGLSLKSQRSVFLGTNFPRVYTNKYTKLLLY